MAIFDLVDLDDVLIHDACLLQSNRCCRQMTASPSEPAELTLGPRT
jgi:hypothetical protein